MGAISGLGKIDRQRLSETIRKTKGIISVSEAAEILRVPASDAAKLLSRWTNKGWLSRVKRGLYVPIPLESRTIDVPLEDPWVIAERLFSPCYIGGWSAAEYWGLTEQIFTTIVVMTVTKPRDRNPNFKGTTFLLRTIQKRAMFGLKSVWKKEIKVFVSDPTRTIVDLLSDPQLGGGIRSTVDIFTNYLRSENKDMGMLIEYASRLGNGAVFKRLGFLLERFGPNEGQTIEACRSKLTMGNSKLDPKLAAEKLITRWRLWLPQNWSGEQ
jgi:predicted transcriptional regulator of viral defense system